MVRSILFLSVLLLFVIPCPRPEAEMTTALSVSEYLLFSRLSDGNIGIYNILSTDLDFKSSGNSFVKGEIEFSALVMDRIVPDFPRAYIKVRLGETRWMIGKNRLSWGQGFLFNAGDVIFNSMSLDVDMMQSELRSETDILISAYIPLGRFSFIETVFLPFPVLGEPVPGLLVPLPTDISEVSAGMRISGKLQDITLEAGYLYQGKDTEGKIVHKPYAAIQTHLFFDLYASCSCIIPQDDPQGDEIAESIALSWGIFRLFSLEGDAGISLRLESGVYPFGEWAEAESSVIEPYGIYLFPEIAYSPGQTMSFTLRSILSPVDMSGIIMTGMSWNIYQGFTLGATVSCMFGDDNDTFGFRRAGDFSFNLSGRYVFGE